MIKRVFLIGNPNVGKSVVFSRLTGVHVVSSNYPGTTVEISRGYLKIANDRLEVIDLPGTYSLQPSSRAEEVAVSLLKDNQRHEMAVVNVVDATNLERNLFLTLQLIEEGYPVVVCLNMCDDTAHRGINIDAARLSEMLGVAVIPTCGLTGSGVKPLIEAIRNARTSGGKERTHLERWQEIGRIVEETQHLSHRHHNLREILEDASLRPFSGMLIASLVIYASFRFVRFLAEWLIANVFDPAFYDIYQPLLIKISSALGSGGFLHHLLIGELIDGRIDFKQSLGLLTTAPYIEIAMVLPYIISFYLVLGILEDVGFLPRLAMLLDNILHRLGLHGFTIIPILLGFGCNVPGIIATRVLESRRERFIAATIIAIGVPCVPLQAMIFGFLGKFGGLYVASVYLTLLLVIILLGMILNRFLKGYSPEFLLEIPPYRLPPLSILFKKLYFRIKGFLIDAMPVVLLGVLVINILLFLKLFDLFTMAFEPLIKGLFGLPKEAVVGLAIGFLRKDVAVGMLMPLGLSVKQLFIATALLAMSFPCVATFAVLLKELGLKDFLKSVFVMLAVGTIAGTLLNILIPG
ncbi:MAG: ferrous iron transporter B [Candidatus Omnitrophota bacterium]